MANTTTNNPDGSQTTKLDEYSGSRCFKCGGEMSMYLHRPAPDPRKFSAPRPKYFLKCDRCGIETSKFGKIDEVFSARDVIAKYYDDVRHSTITK